MMLKVRFFRRTSFLSNIIFVTSPITMTLRPFIVLLLLEPKYGQRRTIVTKMPARGTLTTGMTLQRGSFNAALTLR